MSKSLRVAVLVLAISILGLALGALSPAVSGNSPYASALADLSVASASADPPGCDHLECHFNKFEIWVCLQTTNSRKCLLDVETETCTNHHC